MKNSTKGFVFFILVVIIGLSFIVCDNNNSKDLLDETIWFADRDFGIFSLEFNSPNFTKHLDGAISKGTYNISSNSVTLVFDGGDIWVGKISGNLLSFDGEDIPTFIRK